MTNENNQNNLKTYTFSVCETLFPQTFDGEIKAESEQEAIQQIKEIYAVELDTVPEEVTILSLTEKQVNQTFQSILNYMQSCDRNGTWKEATEEKAPYIYQVLQEWIGEKIATGEKVTQREYDCLKYLRGMVNND